MYGLLADTVVLIHFLFVAFVVTGGFLVLRWPRVAWFHLPSALWGALIEFTGWICPLTPLENRFRLLSGRGTYETGFIEHYIMPLLYPPDLHIETQYVLGAIVLLVNGCVYFVAWRRGRKAGEGKDRTDTNP